MGTPVTKHNVRLTIINVMVDELRDHPHNPRIHPANQIRQLKASINEFGLIWPVLIDWRGMIISGHARVQAAKELGYEEVPCIRADHLSEAQVRAFVIADNRLAQMGKWNAVRLAEELKEIRVSFPELDPNALGFSVRAFDQALAKAAEQLALPLEKTKPIVEPQEILDPYPGDIWQKGDHRIVYLHDRDRALVAAITASQDTGSTPFSASAHSITTVTKSLSKMSRKRRSNPEKPILIACGWPKSETVKEVDLDQE